MYDTCEFHPRIIVSCLCTLFCKTGIVVSSSFAFFLQIVEPYRHYFGYCSLLSGHLKKILRILKTVLDLLPFFALKKIKYILFLEIFHLLDLINLFVADS